MPRSSALLAAGILALAVAGCNQTASAPPPALSPVGPLAALPGGTGCSAEVARTRAVLDADMATGNVATSVGRRFGAELDQASSVCAAGRDAEAVRMVEATKARFGYR